MAGPLRTAMTFLQDGVSIYQAGTWNTPYGQAADYYDTHITNTSQGGVTLAAVQHSDTHIQKTTNANNTARYNNEAGATNVHLAIDQLQFAWDELMGLAAGSYYTTNAIPITLTQVASNFNSTNSTANPTANAWARRDGNGELQAVGFGAVPTTTGGAANASSFEADAPTGYVGSYFVGKLNGVTKFNADAAGNLTIAATLTAASLSLTTALFASLVSDYRPTTSVTAGHISVLAGGILSDGGGNQIGPVGSTLDLNIVSAYAQPTGSNAQWLALSIPVGWNGSAANLVAAIVASVNTGPSPTKPAMPPGNIPIGWLLWRGAGINVPGAFISSDILDARFGGGGSAGGGGGTTDANLRTAPFMLFGTSAYASAGFDMSVSQGTARIHKDNVRSGANQASVTDLTRNHITTSLPAQFSQTGAKAVQINASVAGTSPGPQTISNNGLAFTNTTVATTVATTTAGVSGPRYLVADLSGGGPGWTLLNPMPTTPPSNANYVLLAVIPYDAVTDSLYSKYIDWSPIQNISSTGVTLLSDYVQNASALIGFTNASVAVTPSNMSPAKIYIPSRAMVLANLVVNFGLRFTGGATTGAFYPRIGISSNGTYTQYGSVNTTNGSTGANGIIQTLSFLQPLALSGGIEYDFVMQAFTDAATTLVDIYYARVDLIVFKG